jgi:hypothetical protein
MAVLEEGEIGESLYIEEKRAGEEKKIGEHLVAVVIRGQVRKAVEHVIAASSVFFYDVVNCVDKFLESFDRIEPVDLGFRVFRHYRGMARKPEIDNLLPPSYPMPVKMFRESFVNRYRIRMPDDIVARQDAFEDFI